MPSEGPIAEIGIPSGVLPERIAGKYRPIRTMAAGGMGIVYEVEHENTGERLALKVLRGGAADVDPAALERFRREARVFSLVKSDHIVRVLDADTAAELGGAPFLVMELLEGADLAEVVGEEPQPRERVVDWLHQIARPLDRAHALGVVHRDLKPENLFLAQRPDGSPIVKILDFGIAKVRAPEERKQTASGTILGTPLYMAPEQAAGEHEKVGPGTDQWSIAMIAYRFLNGVEYWTAGNVSLLLAELVFQRTKAPSERGDDFGPGFDAWFLRSTDRDPTQRWQSVREQVDGLADALSVPRPSATDPALEQTAAASSPLSRPTPVSRPSRPSPVKALGASVAASVASTRHAEPRRFPTAWVVALAAAVGVLVWLLVRGPDEPPRQPVGAGVAPATAPAAAAAVNVEPSAAPAVAPADPPLGEPAVSAAAPSASAAPAASAPPARTTAPTPADARNARPRNVAAASPVPKPQTSANASVAPQSDPLGSPR